MLRTYWPILLLVSAVGCTPSRASVQDHETEPVTPLGANHDPAQCGTLSGQVSWRGPLPVTPSTLAPRVPGDFMDRTPLHFWPNPNAPQVDVESRGLREAVVFLREVDPSRSRPWDLPPVRVELVDAKLHVIQGETVARTGFLRRGERLEMVSREDRLHLLRARGANFFSQPLTQPGVVRSRRLDRAGCVELSSGASYFWMRSHLFVQEHPYITRTDSQGRYTLTQVPAGTYEVVAWLPNWREEDHDVNGDTGFRTQVIYQEPLEQVQRVTISAGETETREFTFAAQ